jgi:hypothetical protein
MATIELRPEEAIVLLDFLSRFAQDEALTIEHPAEERILWDLCAILEPQVAELFDPEYLDKLGTARTRVAVGDWK